MKILDEKTVTVTEIRESGDGYGMSLVLSDGTTTRAREKTPANVGDTVVVQLQKAGRFKTSVIVSVIPAS